MGQQRRITAILGITLIIFSLIPISSAGANANIVITDVTPTNLSPGDTIDVTFIVNNDGSNDARHITLDFRNTDSLSVIGASSVYISSINAWNSKTVTVKVHVTETTSNGAYELPVYTTYDEYAYTAGGYNTTTMTPKTLGMVFNVEGEIIIDVSDVTTDPTVVRPGENYVTVTTTLSNSGGGQAKEVKSELECRGGFKPSRSATNIYYVGVLNSGSQSSATFYVDVAEGIKDGYHTLPLTITYNDIQNNEYSITKDVRLLIEPKPNFEIVSSFTEPAKIRSGDHVLLHVSLKNVGSEKSESVSVRSAREAEVPFDFDVKSDYIGDLNIGEVGEAILEFDVDKDPTPKSYQQSLEIRCTGDRDLGDDNVYIFYKEVLVNVSSSRGGSNSLPGFGTVYSLFAFVFLILLFSRRKWQ